VRGFLQGVWAPVAWSVLPKAGPQAGGACMREYGCALVAYEAQWPARRGSMSRALSLNRTTPNVWVRGKVTSRPLRCARVFRPDRNRAVGTYPRRLKSPLYRGAAMAPRGGVGTDCTWNLENEKWCCVSDVRIGAGGQEGRGEGRRSSYSSVTRYRATCSRCDGCPYLPLAFSAAWRVVCVFWAAGNMERYLQAGRNFEASRNTQRYVQAGRKMARYLQAGSFMVE